MHLNTIFRKLIFYDYNFDISQKLLFYDYNFDISFSRDDFEAAIVRCFTCATQYNFSEINIL